MRLVPIVGQPPNLVRPPRGCTFHPRCPYAFDRCRVAEPPLIPLPDGQLTRCWLYDPSEVQPAGEGQHAPGAVGVGVPGVAPAAVPQERGHLTPATVRRLAARERQVEPPPVANGDRPRNDLLVVG